MVKKKLISKEKLDEIKGFEEIMDLVIDEHEKLEVEKKQREAEKLNDSYLLYNFLEDEAHRLEKLSKFFGTKINNYKNFNQTSHILKKQDIQRKQIKKDLVEFQMSEYSPLNKHLEKLFNALF
ncbi:hypothetical protein BMS_1412 [Halobacteriovorax marinus SJ]|uniref:Uncharacterized protein n=1 Tax=Halobacteriovorax marinus (strain ATCC BAA-682 / DSM 15412 / SJ) TaxID=862908 RepID=E1X048_HALMS|nr:hypothetical protein [Halobacteriovorax marinus]CBW26275.1 hypothetical protein BMS_1412 [Halobacteriovorax marinus SJ]